MKNFTKIFVSIFLVGYINFAPGTWGSLTSILILFPIIKLSSLLNIPNEIISIKATSNEKIGFIGDGLGIAAEAIVQISNEKLY